MSLVHDKLQRPAEADRDLWYLKIPDGSVFGPVAVSVLAEWAEQLRIAPGNEVSTDKKKWLPAESISDLKMVWVAKLSGGASYGPFNILAVPHLHQNGTLASDVELHNKVTGEVKAVSELLSDTSRDEAHPPAVKAESSRDIDAESKWKDRYETEKAARRKLEAQHEKDVGSIVSELQAAKEEIAKIKKESTKRISEQSKTDKEKIKGAQSKEAELLQELDRLKKLHKDNLDLLKMSQKKEAEAAKRLKGQEEIEAKLDQAQKREAEGARRLTALAEVEVKFDQAEKRIGEITAELARANEAREVEEKALADAEEKAEKLESKQDELSRESASRSEAYKKELDDRDSEIQKLHANVKLHQENVVKLESASSALEEKLEKVIRVAEEKQSDMSFKFENMQKELETQKTLYAKIEGSESSKDTEYRAQIDAALKKQLDAEGLAREYKGELEQLRESAETLSKGLEDKVAELSASLEHAKADTARIEEEKSSVADKLLALRHDSGRTIEDLTQKVEALDSACKERDREAASRAEATVLELEKTRSEQAAEYRELEAGSKERIAELTELVSRLEDETKGYRDKIAGFESDLAQRADLLNAAEASAQAAREQLDEASGSRRKEQEDSQERIGELSDTVSRLEEEAAGYRTRIEGFEADLAERAASLKAAELSTQAATEKLSDAEHAARNQVEEANASSRRERESLESELADVKEVLRNKEEAFTAEHKLLNQSVKELRTKLDDGNQLNMEKQRELESTILSLRDENETALNKLRLYKDESINHETAFEASLDRANEEKAELKAKLDETINALESQKLEAARMSSRVDELDSELQSAEAAKVELSEKVGSLEVKVDTERSLNVDAKDKYSRDAASFTEQELKYKDMLAEDRAQMESLRNEISEIRSALKSVTDERDVLIQSQTQQRSEASALSIDKGIIAEEKKQLVSERDSLKEDLRSMSETADALSKSLDSSKADHAKAADELNELKARFAEEEKKRIELSVANDSQSNELAAEVKRLKDVSNTSAEVVKRMNGQIVDYREKYQLYEGKVQKLLTELEEKKTEMTELRRNYEPLLKQSQRNEKDLLKKVARLETEKGKLARPVAPLPERIGGIVENVRLSLTGAEGFLRRYPHVARNSAMTAALVLCVVLIFKVGSVERKMPAAPENVAVPLLKETEVALTPEQTEIERKVEAAENAVLSVIDEMASDPGEPETVEIAALNVAPDPEELPDPVEIEEIMTVTPEPVIEVEVVQIKPVQLDLDLEPIVPVKVEEKPVVKTVPPKLRWPVISVPGTTVEYTGKICRIVFDDGIFPYMTVIPQESIDVLSEVAAQVKGSVNGFTMIVEGHCDSVPLSGKSSVQSNYKLGMERAEAVIELLKTRCGLPAEFLIATSVGEKEPPYSNDDPLTRKKNRTVILEIIPN